MAACGASTKLVEAVGEPVVAAGGAGGVVHALLDHDPLAVVGEDEGVEVEGEAVLDGGAVDLGDEAAGAGERVAVEAGALGDGEELGGGLARVAAAAAADVEAELGREGGEAAFQGAHDARW